MCKVILALALSLMAPAYAQQGSSSEAANNLNMASGKLRDLLNETQKKQLPLSDTDKLAMKQAIDDFDKAMKDYYQIDNKKSKKHPFKSIGSGIVTTIGTFGGNTGLAQGIRATQAINQGIAPYPVSGSGGASALSGLPSPGGMGMIIGPPSSMAPAGMYPVMQMGNTTILPNGLPH